MRHQLLFFLALFAPALACAQNFVLKQYTSEDGLPANEVYSVLEDKQGYLWLATDHGVSRFNGYTFENFDLADGLLDMVVFVLEEDSAGRVWMATMSDQICYYDQGKIYPYIHNDVLADEIKNRSDIATMQISDDELLIAYHCDGSYRVRADGQIEPLDEMNTVNSRLMSNGASLYAGKQSVVYPTEVSFRIYQDDSLLVEHTPTEGLSYEDTRNKAGAVALENEVLFYNNQMISRLSYDGSMIRIPNEDGLMMTYLDRQQRLWMCYQKTGVVVYDRSLDGPELFRLPSVKFVTDLCEDRQGEVWLSTLQDGIYRWNEVSFTTYGEELGLAYKNVEKLDADPQGNIYVASVGGYVYQLDTAGVMHYLSENIAPRLDTRIRDLKYHAETNDLWITWGGGIHKLNLDNGDVFHAPNYPGDEETRKYTIAKDARCWPVAVVWPSGLTVFHPHFFMLSRKELPALLRLLQSPMMWSICQLEMAS